MIMHHTSTQAIDMAMPYLNIGDVDAAPSALELQMFEDRDGNSSQKQTTRSCWPQTRLTAHILKVVSTPTGSRGAATHANPTQRPHPAVGLDSCACKQQTRRLCAWPHLPPAHG